jgi:hypothetical protein
MNVHESKEDAVVGGHLHDLVAAMAGFEVVHALNPIDAHGGGRRLRAGVVEQT